MSSQCAEGKHFLAPLPILGSPEEAFARAALAVAGLGGEISENDGSYLHAVFTSRLLRFKDDLELLLNREEGVIHVRSASRLGSFDFGVNRRRVERLRHHYNKGG